MAKQNIYRLVFGGVVFLFAVAFAIFAATGQFTEGDRAGPLGLLGAVAHAATDPAPSGAAPNITSLTNHTLSSITVNWDEADDTDQHWVYSVKSDGSDGRLQSVPAASPDPESTSSHSTTITGLDVGTEYWFAVLGNKSPSETSPKEWFSWSGWAKGTTLAVGIVWLGQDVSVAEGGTANLTVTSTVAPTSALTVNYAIGTDNDPATVDGDSDDYTGNATGSIEIAVGATQGIIPVVINDDSDIDDGTRETLVVTITMPDVPSHRVGLRTSATVTINEGVCDRTTQVQSAILSKLTDISDCADVTDSDFGVNRIGNVFDLSSQGITELKARDFRGLTGLYRVELQGNSLATLPEDVFAGLAGLHALRLDGNSLTTLPEDVFDGLTGLFRVELQNNSLTALPEGRVRRPHQPVPTVHRKQFADGVARGRVRRPHQPADAAVDQ